MSDYLWDKTGEPDAEIERLEQALSRYQHLRPFVFPYAPQDRRWLIGVRFALAGAAAAMFVIALFLFWPAGRGDVQWQARRAAGQPRLNANIIGAEARVQVGGVITTDAYSQVELDAAGHGRIRVLPGSVVKLVQSGDRHQRLALEHGSIEASLFAPPFMFSFDTPSGTAYDIGCAFTLSVDDQGHGLVRVTSGWVQFEIGMKQELAPAGMVIPIEPGIGPGTPYFEDAAPAFTEALAQFDSSKEPAARLSALRTITQQARPRDTYTLLRLMRDATPEERGVLFDRAVQLRPPPAWVTREGIMRHEEAMMDAWVQSLGYGDAKRWWVHWKDRF